MVFCSCRYSLKCLSRRQSRGSSPCVKNLCKDKTGGWYNKYKDTMLDPKQLESRIVELIDDEEVENKKGIYPYLLTGQEKYLNLRTFAPKDIQKMYQTQNGICPMCKKHFELAQMDADHIIPWAKGGKTNLSNGQMLCRPCNMQKSAN